MDFQLCTPQPTYVIVEQIHRKAGLPSIPRTGGVLGPSLHQVFRRVLQVCAEQDLYFNGRRVEGTPTTWQYIQELLLPGEQFTTRPTGQRQFVLVYAGFRNIVRPLPRVGNLLPESWTRQYDLGTPPSPFVYGTDPIPTVQLYGNDRAEFVMPGGQPPPTALGIYHSSAGRLELPSQSARDRMVQELVQPVPTH